MDFVSAFLNAGLNKRELVICGEGEAAEQLQKLQSQDKRIHFLGRCEHSDVMLLQKNALALVNPRKNDEEYTKYSFPSKNMEYLSAGVPMIAYLLDGMPEEYRNYMVCIKDSTESSFIDALKKVDMMKFEERLEFGNNAKSFVNSKKNAKAQMQRVLDMIYEYRR